MPIAFQLTRPVRGEPTVSAMRFSRPLISTHSPRAGRTIPLAPVVDIDDDFNSLAPCGANLLRLLAIALQLTFQLTRPVRGEPYLSESSTLILAISTHSPRAGRTENCLHFLNAPSHFNSLAPCGANPVCEKPACCRSSFQLTRPVRGEPIDYMVNGVPVEISTHSPRAGRTHLEQGQKSLVTYFNSLAPCGANPCRPNFQ